MQKLVILLACLVCWTAAGRLGWERKLQWLDNVRSTGQDDLRMAKQRTVDNIPTINQRQKFLIDVLLQVQRPLVNSELIEMGRELITEGNMYTEPADDILREFLEQCRQSDILTRSHVYSDLNMQHVGQLVGLYKFLVLARDWSTFQSNVCFARRYINPVMFVNALTLAVRDRSDTQQLIMPAINEILPQLFYDRDVIVAAQSIDWDNLISSKTSTVKPNLLNIMGLGVLGLNSGRPGLWHPWQQMRMNMIGMKAGNVLGAIGNRRNIVAGNDDRMLVGTEEKIVVPVDEQKPEIALLTDDVGLNIFWNNVMTERLMQTVAGGKQQLLKGGRNQMSYSNNLNLEDILGMNQERLGNMQRNTFEDLKQNTWQTKRQDMFRESDRLSQDIDIDTPTSRIGRVGLRNTIDQDDVWTRNMPRDTSEVRRMLDTTESRGNWGSQMSAPSLPVTDINNERLLHVSRRKLQQRDDIMRTTAGRQFNDNDELGQISSAQRQRLWNQRINEDDSMLMGRNRQRFGRTNKIGSRSNIGNGRTVIDNERYTGQNIGHFVKPEQIEMNSRIEGMRVRDQEFDNVLRRGLVIDNEREENFDNRRPTEWNEHRYTSRQGERIIDGDRLMSRRTIEEDKDDLLSIRRPRSIKSINITPTEGLMIARSGEIFIQSLQQLVARLNMEKIALGMEKTGRTMDRRNLNLMTTNGVLYQQKSLNSLMAKQTIQRVMQELKTIIDTVLEQNQINRRSDEVLKVIGDILIERNGQQGTNIWDQLYTQIQRTVYGLIGNDIKPTVLSISTGNLREPIYQDIVEELVQLIVEYKQNLKPYTVDELIVDDVVVNDIDVDRLVTYTELVDSDLINLVDQQLLQSDMNNVQKLQKKVVARQQRLNQQPFTITYDITSKRNQRVVVRTFLGPKIQGNRGSLNENLQNFIQLDAFVKNLNAGTNIFQLNSRDITWTGRDVSTISQIYQRIMSGQSLENLVGTDCRFPQRLLIPRGTVDGLDVQLLVVVTPVNEEDRLLQQLTNTERLCGLGIASINLDSLPLNFPLDRKIIDMETLLVPNILIKDTIIQHDDRVRVSRI